MRKIVLFVLLLGSAACSTDTPPVDQAAADSMTKRQKDSVLAQSKVPGAKPVGAAMNAADAEAARTAHTDSVTMGSIH